MASASASGGRSMAGPDWLSEIDLSNGSTVMGTRRLGKRPWLVEGPDGPDLIPLKQELLAERPDDVVAFDGDTHRGPARETLGLIDHARGAAPTEPDEEPLVAAARSVVEDLCLLRRDSGRWTLAAACVCFPSRWRLSEKIGRGVTEIHGPVDGYSNLLADRVTSLFDALGPSPVWRRNWFVHPDGAWFQPERRPGGDPVIPANQVPDQLFLRSERQTLRTVVPGWILFTIRVQQVPLGQACIDDDFARRLGEWASTADPAVREQRGVSSAQAIEISAAITETRTRVRGTYVR